MYAVNGSIAMNADASSTTQGGNIYYRATGNVTVGVLNAGTGGIWIDAGGDILDAQNDTVTAQDAAQPGFAVPVGTRVVNLIAATAFLNAVGSIGVAGNPLDTTIGTLASRSGTSTYIYESDNLIIGGIATSSVNRTHLNSTNLAISTASLAGSEGGQHVKIETIDGNLFVNEPVTAGLDTLLAANRQPATSVAAAGNLFVNFDVRSTNGALTLLAEQNINQGANGDLLITAGAANTIYAYAVNGSITMADGASSTTQGGNIYYRAPGTVADPTSGNIALGLLDAKGGSALAGSVAVHAGNNISDNNDGVTINTLNVRATNLQLIATRGKIGDADLAATADVNRNAIDTEVNTLAAASALGIYVRELDGVTIDNTGDIILRRVNLDSSNNTLTIFSREDLTTTAENGPIKLQSVDGNIIVNAGAAGNPGISANGSGDVLLQTLTSGTIIANALVQSGTGDISVKSADDLALTDNFRTSAPGTFYFSSGRDITWAAGVPTLNTAGVHVRLVAGRDILLGEINANGTGDVGLSAGRNIVDANDAGIPNTRNVFARNLAMQADSDGDNIGIIGGTDLGNPDPDANIAAIDTQVVFLAARSATGIYVREVDGVTVDSVSVVVRQVNFNSTDPLATQTLEDLQTTNNGPIKLQSVNGDIAVNPGTITAFGVSANGTGNVLLQTLNSGSIAINAGVDSERGAISLIARQNITQSANGDLLITTGSNTTTNTIYAYAVTGSITMNADASSTTQGGNIYYRAPLNVTLGTLTAGSGGAWVNAGGSILDAQGDTVAPGAAGFATATGAARVVNVGARTAVLQAGGSIGVEGNPIDTNVDVIAGASKDGIFIRESNQLIVGQIASSTVQRVHFRSDAAPVSGNAEFGLRATDGPIRVLTEQNNLFIDRTVNASASANAATDSAADESATRKDVTMIALQGAIEQRAGTAFSLTSNAAIGATILNLADTSSFTVGMRIAVWDADSGRQDFDVVGVGAGTIQISSPLTRAITAATSQIFQQRSQVVGEGLYLSAKNHAHLYDASVTKLISKTETNERLDAWEHVNVDASRRGDDFLVDLETKIPGLVIPDAVKQKYRFAETYDANGYSLYIVNSRNVQVQDVTAGISNSPNVYIETLGASEINVTAPVKTLSSNPSEGGIVLVAGQSLKIAPTGRLETVQSQGPSYDQIVVNETLATRFFRFIPTDAVLLGGKPGIEVPPNSYYTTYSILSDLQAAAETNDLSQAGGPKHVFMQVAIQFGATNDRGFENFIAYADRQYAMSHAANGTLNGTTAVLSKINGTPSANNEVLRSVPLSNFETAWFQRQTSFADDFIKADANGVFENYAVMRRANDFFMFQNTANIATIQDLTFETKQINVQRDAFSPTPPTPLAPAIQVVLPAPPRPEGRIEQPLVLIEATKLETRPSVEPKADIVLFRMNEFDDKNEDGQPDDNELPSSIKEVLDKVNSNDLAKKIEFPNDRKGNTKPSVQPTQDEINRVKEALQRDPEAQVGVYSIVREKPNGDKDVLDVFPIRDPDPMGESGVDSEPETIEPIPTNPGQQPPGNVNDGAFLFPTRSLWDDADSKIDGPRNDHRLNSVNPAVSLAILLGAISLRSTPSTQASTQSAATEHPVALAREARRQRRRESLLSAWSQSRHRDA
ncbi:MAG: beta strand repeat-containing protein [Planctomycetota bacterium]